MKNNFSESLTHQREQWGGKINPVKQCKGGVE